MNGKRLSSEKERGKLYRQLYVAASYCVDPKFIADREAVSIKRDYVCASLFNRGYKELTNDELECAIQEMQIESGFMDAGQLSDENKKRITQTNANFIATQAQLRTLRMYAINCALVYCKFDNAQFYDANTKDTYSGEQVRELAKEMFEKAQSVPKPIFTFLFSNWINPKLNELMIELGYKKYAVDASKFHLDYLKQAQANKLIQIFASIWTNVSQRDCKPIVPGTLSIN